MIFSLNAPMFDLLVLAVVENEDAYGYQISQIIKNISNTKDSALYPVLKRLQDSHYVTAYDEQFQGRNRRYYRITEDGRGRFQELVNEWNQYKYEIDQIIERKMDRGQE